MKEKSKRGGFTGSLGFVLAAAGSAVGLGNIWRQKMAEVFFWSYTSYWHLPSVLPCLQPRLRSEERQDRVR